MFTQVTTLARCFIISFLTLIPSLSLAEINLDEDTLTSLASSKAWYNLLHYRQGIFTNTFRSQADDPRFFYSPTGDRDAKDELKAFIKAINDTNISVASDSVSPACRFPARYQWLRKALAPTQALPNTSCPELEDWLQQLNAEHITLVFAASYLNSPSSMFGHTFLRVDPAGMGADNLLLARTISYAANAEAHDNELMFAYRGIFGGYPGITTVEPYYQKLKLYSDIENRDLWEYRLDLSSEEVRTLLLHTWEIKDIRFDYYFFDENCAYRLFTLIDVARPGIELTDALPTLRAIPSDTVRVVVDKGIVSNIQYRPSTSSIIKYQLNELSPSQKDAVESYLEMDFDLPAPMSDEDQANSLETAYELQQFRTIDEKLPREISAPVSFALLKKRGEIKLQTTPRSPPTPGIRDDEGHDTLRFGLFGGQFGDNHYVAVEWRPAYHDLDDPLPGYRKGAHLQFFNTQARWYTHNNELQLEQFKFVEIISLTPRDRFFSPLSWKAGGGARRSWISGEQRHLSPYVDGFAGLTYQVGPALATAALTASAEPSKLLPSGGMLEGGALIQTSYQSKSVRLLVSAEQRFDSLNDNEDRRFVEAKLSFSINEHHALQLRMTDMHSKYDSEMDIGLGWYGYF
ncbi:DUF4105 domain-containing protein [Hahella ganghwensis]|uniref:Lnb N-terminal periplasmic domain-containing protein n=1 Tax=Hahella ganghwensis TaxID=286420 RepID=UPI000374DC28|nr:DUF4105 domain-containing protein [Hahella ganghwensis]